MKPIKLNDDIKQQAYNLLTNLLNDYNGDEGLNIKITSDVLLSNTADIKKPFVYITTDAYLKIKTLIDSSSDELAWHGTVTKVDSNYLIDDVFVYPQIVTSTTVDADDEAYAKWLMELDDDVINRLRFQGHSHVNMTVSPSGRDTTNWQSFLNLLKDNEFYLFCIANKKDQFYWTIYDMTTNIIFENKDIEMRVIDPDGLSIKDWVTENVQTYIKRQPVSKPAHEFAKSYTCGVLPRAPYHQTTMDDDTGPVFNESTQDYIPTELLNVAGTTNVGYDLETDTYYADGYIRGFVFDSTWGAYTCVGFRCRTLYGVPPKNASEKKTKKTTAKKNKTTKKK